MARNANTPTGDAASRRIDAVFDALGHQRRRTVLHYLRERPDGRSSVDELAEALADRRGNGTDDGPTPERVTASLVHHHLPKLEDAGVVEYETETGTVRYLDDPLASACLEVVTGLEHA